MVGTGYTKGQSGLCPGELAVRRRLVCKPIVQSAEWPGSPRKPGGGISPGALAGRLLGGDELEPSGVGLPSVNEGGGRAGGQGKRSRVREPFGSQRLP